MVVSRKGKTASSPGKRTKMIRFQLSRSGIAGIGVVCFCIFLWMFLLGVWAGQSLLYSPIKYSDSQAAPAVFNDDRQVPDVIQLEADRKKIVIKR